MADPDDHRFARDLAEEVATLLLDTRAELVAAGATAAALKAEGDRRSHELIMRRLRDERPGDAVLSEEGDGEDGRRGTDRLSAERIWVVDPLDGTREFSEPPRDDWAVHIALVEQGVPTAGAVALPARAMTLSTLEPSPCPPERVGPPRVIVSRSRPPAVATYLADAIGGVLVEMGSAGAKASAVVLGDADVYPHSGGQYEWDSCAPVAVAAAVGLWTSRIDGSPLRYNRPDPYLPDLLVCHPSILDQVRGALDSFRH